MPLSRSKLIILGVAGLFILIIVLLFVGILPGLRPRQQTAAVTLNVLGIFDKPSIFQDLANSYRQSRPKTEIKYRQLNADNYENELLNALASPQPPDIFMFHGSWLPKHYDKILPLNESQLPLVRFRELFPTVVEQNFAPDGIIYALPLYIDTLALFYNKDIFDDKGIALPPKTWTEFQDIVSDLRELDKIGKINKAAAAIGGSNKSVNRASDLLNLLMLQAGTPMVDQSFTRAAFAREGENQLKFYTQFADAKSPYFTWNEALHYSLDNFAEETTAMIFNYAYQIPVLKDKNPFLNFAAALMPQPSGAEKSVNYANYWGLAVSNKSRNPAAAWDFILSVTADPETSRKYLNSTGHPPALRSLINERLNDPVLGVFARQSLTARSWPQIDNVAIENSFSKMIESVISGRLTARQAIQQAENEISQVMAQKRR